MMRSDILVDGALQPLARAAYPKPVESGWRRWFHHPALMEYRWLALLVVLGNVVFAVELWQQRGAGANAIDLLWVTHLMLANFALAVLIRQQRVINALFWLATRIPNHWPLWLRRRAGKVFHFGGVHYAGSVMGSVWAAVLFAGLWWRYAAGEAGVSSWSVAISGAILLPLLLMIILAWGPIRARYHNVFELSHRFLGWTVLGLFWAQAVSLSADQQQPFWGSVSSIALLVMSLSILSPWLTLKRVPIRVTRPSNHVALVEFDYGDTPFAGSSNSISLSPLREWHAFANIPTPGRSGYRLAISRAGDWTGRFIDQPPTHVWVKGITTSGVARIERLFKRVVYVGTGSGIGPILPHLLKAEVPAHLIWSARSPVATYGEALVDEITDACADVLIWDTQLQGKPNLSTLALQCVQQTGAEAVIVIANQKLTRQVVWDMESAGIPAYGAIWDS